MVETENIITHLASLIPPVGDDEAARRLDVLMYRMMLAKAEADGKAYNGTVRNAQKIAFSLSKKGSIPEVRAAKDTLEKMKTDAFWQTVDIATLDKIRIEIRELMHFLKREMKTKVINISDNVLFEREGERFTAESDLEGYYERAARYVTENENKPVFHKLKNNIKLSEEDWIELEDIFWHEVGTADEYKKAVHKDIPLGKFVWGLTGLSVEAAHAAFSEFLDEGAFTEAQINFVQCFMDLIIKYGTLEKEEMGAEEFAGGVDFVEIFEDNIDDFKKIISIVESINANALPMAA